MAHQYWVVGATYAGSGKDDRAPEFLGHGYWTHLWENGEVPEWAANRLALMQPGDGIAIKRMMGQGAKTVRIVALGVMTDVDGNDGRVYVNWLVKDLDRVVKLRGCTRTIHGPYKESDAWARRVFCL